MTGTKWFGPRLKALRKQADLTQQEVADQVGVTTQIVREWERGDKMPMLERIPRLAEILGVPPGSFFPDDRDSHPEEFREGCWPRGVLEERLDRLESQLRLVLAEVRSLGGQVGPLGATPPPGDAPEA